MVPPNIVDDQFILPEVTGVASGQNEKNQTGARNQSDAILIAMPNLPSDHRRGGRGFHETRLQIRQLIVMKYEERIETPPRELMAFKAVESPRLMQASIELTTTETKTARTGTFHPGVTLLVSQIHVLMQIQLTRDSQFEPGKPLSRAKDQICLDAVATSLMQQETSNIMTIAVMTLVPA
jgi:hypothetical protein